MTTSPLVSVIIPCYGQAHLLPEAIDSVLGQSDPRHEIVVVDDGSPDGTKAVVARYASLGRVRYVRQVNRGLPSARNAGITASRGDYLVFLDADDWLASHHLAMGLEGFSRHPEVGLVLGDHQLIGDDPTWRHVHTCEPQPDHYAALLRRNFGPLHAIMFRREAVIAAGLFRPELSAAEDYDLLLRVARRHPLHCHHQVVAFYRRYDSQMSRKWDVMLAAHLQVLQAQHRWIRGNAIYEAAYRDGVERYRNHYGERALWQMVLDARAGRYRRAAEQFVVLARWYPQGLAALVSGKVTRMLLGRQVSHRA